MQTEAIDINSLNNSLALPVCVEYILSKILKDDTFHQIIVFCNMLHAHLTVKTAIMDRKCVVYATYRVMYLILTP